MTLGYWMILVAALLPYITVGLAKGGASGYDNAGPRHWADRQQGWRRRAIAAHANHFEAFGPFAAAVVVAELANGVQWIISTLAVAFILLRILYTLAYLADRPTLRSALWSVGLLCVVALFCCGIGR
jgi:uncharacterized MAPEG superfamily protein